MGLVERPGPIEGGDVPRYFIIARLEKNIAMRELSVFIDESGDFGEYDYHSPYYIISMVFHEQNHDISEPLRRLEEQLSAIGYPDHCVHTGPIIRRENEYEYESIDARRKIFNHMITFIKHAGIRYKCFHIEKKHMGDSVEAVGKLAKQISEFVREKYDEFLAFDVVKIYAVLLLVAIME